MEDLLRELLAETRKGNDLMARILEQIEDARVEVAKGNCPEKQKEMVDALRASVAGTPLAGMFNTLLDKMPR